MKLGKPCKLASFAALLCFVECAQAVEGLPPLGGFLPGSVKPEQVGKNLQSQQPVYQAQQALPPVVEEAKPPPSALSEQAQKIKFQLNGIILEGNHVFTKAQLEPLYKDKLHQVITVAELFGIIQNITNYYRNSGYILSRAILPPQHVKGGVVRVRVIEGKIGNVVVTGDPRGTRCLVSAYGHRIAACPPLQISVMEKYLLLANEVPGTDVKAVLSPSTSATGAADLTLVTQNQTFFGYLSYDDYGTRYIGPQQMTANAGINSAIASGDAIQTTWTKTPKGGELTYSDLNYNLPLWDEGIRWLTGATRTQTHPLFVLQPLQIDGVTSNYYTTVTYPIIRRRTENLTLRTGFNYLDSNVTTLGAELYTDHVRSLDLGLTYNLTDRFAGSNFISGDIRKGLPILGYTSNTDPETAETSRPGGYANYTKIAVTISRLQAIRGPWSVYVIAQGQYSLNPLLASEQFTFGGSQLGRGYDVAEIIGDKGAAGSVELRYDWNVGTFLQLLEFYAFYDIGAIWNYKFIGGVPKKQSGTSTGIGVRFFFTKYISGNFMWTQTLTKQVAAEELIGDGRKPRTWFSIVATF